MDEGGDPLIDRLHRNRTLGASLCLGPLLLLDLPGATGPAGAGEVETLRRLVADGAYAQAEERARGDLRQEQDAGRAESPQTVEITILLVEALWRGGKEKSPETRTLAERCVDLSRRLLGEESEDYAWSLSNLAVVLRRTDDLEGAKRLLTTALAIRERLFGPRSMKVALALNTLASPEGMSGDYAAARAHLERALSICDELDPQAAVTANILFNLGSLSEAVGEYETSRDYHARALAIRRKTLPPDHPLTAASSFAVAVMLMRLGDYPQARALYEQTLAIQERVLGPDHPEFAESLSNLANVLTKTGHYADARPMQERALAILERALGSDHSRVLQVRAGLAAVLADLQDFAGAERLMEVVVADQERILGPGHPDLGRSFNQLADAELGLGEAAAAEGHFLRARSILDGAYGPGHPDSAVSLDGLGRVQALAGHNAAAEDFFRQALEVRRARLGASHPAVAEELARLAKARWSRGDARRALTESLQAEEILGAHFGRSLVGLSEREGLEYERVRASGMDTALSVLAATPADLPEDGVERAWIALARSRALVLDEMARLHRAVGSGDDPATAGLYRDLVAATNRLAALVVRGPDPAHADRYASALDSAAHDREDLERRLAERSAPFRARLEGGRTTLDGLRRSLPRGAALVAYALYDGSAPASPAGAKTPAVRSPAAPAYMAFVLSPRHARPLSVPLGGAAEVDRLVDEWRRASAAPPDLLEAAGGPRDREMRQAGGRLRSTIWDPVARTLPPSGEVLVVPDGNLNLVSFATLPAGEDRYLIEGGHTFHYLSAERDLPALAGDEPRPGRGIMLLGGADFDARPDVVRAAGDAGSAAPSTGDAAAAPGANAPTTTASGTGVPGRYRSPAASCDAFRSIRFDPLPASTREVDEIRAAFAASGSALVVGEVIELAAAEASEDAFKRLAPGRRILHLATHAFSLDGGCASSLPSPGRAVEGRAARAPGFSRAAADNPLLLSGLALAGANRRSDAGPGGEDGIVTSEEIATLDLAGVEWAVLSACESGVGRIQTGEGVLGLRRAFQVAGARTLIASLWKVDDDSTREWMRLLYAARLGGRSTAESVREASLAVLRSRRSGGRSTNPFYWGAFAAAGDWR